MSLFGTLAKRRLEPEIMDDPALDQKRHFAALAGLSRINALSASVNILWRPIYQLARRLKTSHLRVLDIASGAGDIPLRLQHHAWRTGLQLEILGLDISPRAVDFARQRAEGSAGIVFEQRDVLSTPLPSGFDVVTSSLFFHHLDNDTAVSLMKSMGVAARQIFLVNDLRRNRAGLLLAYAASRLLTRSDVVHIDAPLSVRAAFTPAEFLDLSNAAGLSNVKVYRRWPCRMLLHGVTAPAS